MPATARAAAHTHTAWSNDYFVLTDNRNYKDVRMSIRLRWKGPRHLGSTLASKTLVPAQYGDTRSEPDQIVLVLKAWMLYRWQGNGGRFLERRSRKEAWERERDALAIGIRKRGARQPCTPTRVPTFMRGRLRCCTARPLQRLWRWPPTVEGAAGRGLEEDCVADAGQWTGCRKWALIRHARTLVRH